MFVHFVIRLFLWVKVYVKIVSPYMILKSVIMRMMGVDVTPEK